MLEEAGIGEEDIDRVCDADDPRLLAAELLSRAGSCSGGSAVSEGVPPPAQAAAEELGAESDSSDDCL